MYLIVQAPYQNICRQKWVKLLLFSKPKSSTYLIYSYLRLQSLRISREKHSVPHIPQPQQQFFHQPQQFFAHPQQQVVRVNAPVAAPVPVATAPVPVPAPVAAHAGVTVVRFSGPGVNYEY